MRGINLKPSRVYQTTSALLEAGMIIKPPVWFTTLGKIPPAEILTRTQPIQHTSSPRKSRTRKPSKLFRPQPLEYEEDRLRRVFYQDHPWELARPRIILENDGKDGQRCDWRRLRQPGRPLTGECVVQRQLWLMQNSTKSTMTEVEAYDTARKEFYALRHEEEVERRVAKEEALWVGAYFGKSTLEVSMDLEDKTYEEWKTWATTQLTALQLARDSAYSGIGTANEDVDDGESLSEEPLEGEEGQEEKEQTTPS